MKKTILSISILAVMSFGSGIALANTTYGTTTSNATTTTTDNGEQVTCSAIGCPVTTIEGLNQLKNLVKQEGQKAYQLKASYSAEVKKEILTKNEKLVQAKKDYKDTILELNNITRSKVADLSGAFTQDLSELNQVLAEVQKKGSKYLRTSEGRAELSEILGQIKELKMKFSSDIREAKNIKTQLEVAKNTYMSLIEKANNEYKQAVSKIDDVYKPQMEKNASDIAKYNESIKISNQLISEKRAVEQKEASELNSLISELMKKSSENYQKANEYIKLEAQKALEEAKKRYELSVSKSNQELEDIMSVENKKLEDAKSYTANEILKTEKGKDEVIERINKDFENELSRYYVEAEALARKNFPNGGSQYQGYLQELMTAYQRKIDSDKQNVIKTFMTQYSVHMANLNDNLAKMEFEYQIKTNDIRNEFNEKINGYKKNYDFEQQEAKKYENEFKQEMKLEYEEAIKLIKENPREAKEFGYGYAFTQ